jgi:uncharacterized protein (TIGR01244 family)
LIGLFIALGAGGSVVGGHVARRLPQARLQKAFAALLVLMAIAIGWQTVPRAMAGDATGPTAAHHPHPTGGRDMASQSTPVPQVPGFRTPRHDLVSGGQPDAADWGRLRNAGVTRVINLRTPDEMAGRDAAAEARAAGLDYVSMPIDGAADVTPAAADALWARLHDARDGRILVHCASGNRVGALLALGAVRADAMRRRRRSPWGARRAWAAWKGTCAT